MWQNNSFGNNFPLLTNFIPINSQTRKNEIGIVINVRDHLRHTSRYIEPTSRRSYSLNLDHSTWRVVIGHSVYRKRFFFALQKTFCVNRITNSHLLHHFCKNCPSSSSLSTLSSVTIRKQRSNGFIILSVSPFCLPLFYLNLVL